MKNTIVKWTIVTTLGIGGIVTQVPFSTAYAASISDLNKQKEDIESKQNDVENKKSDKNDELSNIHDEQESVEAELKRLNTAISTTQVNITREERVR